MIELGSFNLQHFYQLIVLVEYFSYFLNWFVRGSGGIFPGEVRTFARNECENLEYLLPIRLNQRNRELFYWGGQQICV